MSKRIRRFFRNRRGSVLAIVAVMLPATLGTMALAIDLSMLFSARVQAQRAADSGALAGASAYRDFPHNAAQAADSADARARRFAALNDIRGTAVDPTTEVHVELRPADNEVYVHVHRDDIPTWFARFLGFVEADVAADATAQARTAGGVKCLKPLAIPDYWDDTNNDTDGDNLWDPGEVWSFTPGTDVYNPYGSGDDPETGFGSDFRNPTNGGIIDDFGSQLILKIPQGNQEPTEPGWFYPLALDGSGAQAFRDAMTGCAEGTWFIGDSISNEPGAMAGAEDAFLDLINEDAFSYWDTSQNTIANSAYSDYTDNPRVILIALFDPNDLADVQGRNEVVPNNFAYYYLEGFRRQDGTICTTSVRCADNGQYKAPVVGRFMYFAEGVGTSGETGPLVLQLRLVQ